MIECLTEKALGINRYIVGCKLWTAMGLALIVHELIDT